MEQDLLADEKERAEHLMLVDLARNDLGRVCVPGSVRVPRLCRLERTAAVQHLVSTVVGTLAPGRDRAGEDDDGAPAQTWRLRRSTEGGLVRSWTAPSTRTRAKPDLRTCSITSRCSPFLSLTSGASAKIAPVG